MSAALAIDVTSSTTLSRSLSSQNPAIHAGSTGLAWAIGKTASSATTGSPQAHRRQLIGERVPYSRRLRNRVSHTRTEVVTVSRRDLSLHPPPLHPAPVVPSRRS